MQVRQSAVVTTACAGRQSIVLRGFAAEGMVEAEEGFPAAMHRGSRGWLFAVGGGECDGRGPWFLLCALVVEGLGDDWVASSWILREVGHSVIMCVAVHRDALHRGQSGDLFSSLNLSCFAFSFWR